MEPDFTGWASKANLMCADGRVIQPNAFQHQDTLKVPLVWGHTHDDVKKVLGHVYLENKPEGTRVKAFFNKTPEGVAAKEVVRHGDVDSMSIWAGELREKIANGAKQVFHGVIREVSLVLAGANPGAKIDWVNLAHGYDDLVMDGEAIIHTGIPIELSSELKEDPEPSLSHEALDVEKILGTYNPEQMAVFEAVVQHALDTGALQHSVEDPPTEPVDAPNPDPADPVDAPDPNNPDKANEPDPADNPDPEAKPAEVTTEGEPLAHQEGSAMTRNLWDTTDNKTQALPTGELLHSVMSEDGRTKTMIRDEKSGELLHAIIEGGELKHTMTQDDYRGIARRGLQLKSFKTAAEEFALAHGINDIELLFPDARNYTNTPQWDKRRTEWVATVLNSVSHTPYSRVKTLVADITQEAARARGYIKGNMKKEEWFGLTGRKTGPTTIYKKQKLDRDDILDITDFDIVVWMKGEMRLMFEEEVARAIMIGDGRPAEDPANPGQPNPDKVKEPAPDTDGDGVRSILNDHELFVTTVNINLGSDPDFYTIVEETLRNRKYWKGTGTPTLFTSEHYLTEMLLSKDNFGRRRYRDIAELAAELRVSTVVDVELFDTIDNLIGIVVNLTDYNVGTDRGGELNFFDDFDIDFNQYKYLYESRFSGALVKIKSALRLMRVADSSDTLVEPIEPGFNPVTGVVTIPSQTGVTYRNADTEVVLTAGDQPALEPGESLFVEAVPGADRYFANSEADGPWEYTRNQA